MAEAERDPLEMLVDEFLARLRSGERPAIESYAQKYPALATEIREIFPTVQEMELLKSRKEQTSGGRVSLGPVKLERLGDYRIIREIARGGMGIVYEAVQESLQRTVAIKVIPRQMHQEPAHLKRFQREARIAANLHHTNIVEVFGAGEDDGFHYYVMQYVHGVGLDRVLAALTRRKFDENTELETVVRELLAPQSGASDVRAPQRHTAPLGKRYWRSVARLGVQVGGAFAYAHAQGTLHRDIKPANLLLDQQGLARVTDFGLAKAIHAETETLTVAISGTLRYMAPEQFEGRTDARSDIYSLGLSLYELLALRPAHDAVDRIALIRQITKTPPVALRSINPQIPRDLETIVMKAVAHNPAHRYQTAAAMAADLQRFMEDRPIEARRINALERGWRWSRREPLMASLLGVTAVSLTLVAVLALSAYVRVKHALEAEAKQREAEVQQRALAEANAALATEALDRIFERFSTTRSVAVGGMALAGISGQRIEMPSPVVLSKETAALLDDMLGFYLRLAKQIGPTANDMVFRRKVAEANLRVGDIRARLGQNEQALVAYGQAIPIYLQLLDIDTQMNFIVVARLHNEMGLAYRALHKIPEARKEYQQALALIGNIASKPEARYQRARSYYLLGTLTSGEPATDPLAVSAGPLRRPHPPGTGPAPFFSMGPPPPPPPPEASNDPQRPSRDEWDQPPPRDQEPPQGERFDNREAPPAVDRGIPVMLPSGESDQEGHLAKAIDILNELVAQQPPNPNARYLLALCQCELCARQLPRDHNAANAALERATTLLEGLAKDFPDVADYRYTLAETYALPLPLPSQDQPLEAEKRLVTALRISDKLIAEQPFVPQYLASQARICHGLGVLQSRERRLEESEKHCRKAWQLQTDLVAQFPDVVQYKIWQNIFRTSLSDVVRRRGSRAEASELIKCAVADFAEIQKQNPDMVYLNGLLANSYMVLSAGLHEAGDEKGAFTAARQADECQKLMQAKTHAE